MSKHKQIGACLLAFALIVTVAYAGLPLWHYHKKDVVVFKVDLGGSAPTQTQLSDNIIVAGDWVMDTSENSVYFIHNPVGPVYTKFDASAGQIIEDVEVVGNAEIGDSLIVGTNVIIGGEIILANDETIDNATDGDVRITFDEATSTLGQLILESDADGADTDDGDVMEIQFKANDDATNKIVWMEIEMEIDDVTNDSKDGALLIKGMKDNSAVTFVTVNETGMDVLGQLGADSVLISGGLTDIGGYAGGVADDDNDLGVAGDLGVDGDIDANGDYLGDGGAISNVVIHGSTIGAVQPLAGAFTTITASDAVDMNEDSTCTNLTFDAGAVLTLGTGGTLVGPAGCLDAADLTGTAAAFNGAAITALASANLAGNIAIARMTNALETPGAIGGTSPSSGAFTTISASDAVDMDADSTCTNLTFDAGAILAFGAGCTITGPADMIDPADFAAGTLPADVIVNSDNLATHVIDVSDLPEMETGEFIVGNTGAGSNAAVVTMGGGLTVANDGTITIADNTIPADEIGAGTFPSDVIFSNATGRVYVQRLTVVDDIYTGTSQGQTVIVTNGPAGMTNVLTFIDGLLTGAVLNP